jgi:hypothetical protein
MFLIADEKTKGSALIGSKHYLNNNNKLNEKKFDLL